MAAQIRPFILGIGGTTRPGSSTERALQVALQAAAAEGAEVALISGADCNCRCTIPPFRVCRRRQTG